MIARHLANFAEKRYPRRKFVNIAACCMLILMSVLASLSLALVFGYTFVEGIHALTPEFFFSTPRPVGEAGGGMGNAIVGSLIVVSLACLLALPWGIIVGVYLSEYAAGATGFVVRFSTDMLSSVPSIVAGLFAYSVVVVPMGRFSALAAAVALSILMVPVVAKSTEEVLRLVPMHIREAGLALGIPRWKVIVRIVVRGSLSAITTGVMLAIARAAGETAPLLFTALNSRFWQVRIDEPIASLPVQIYTYAISPFAEWQRQAWGGALVLILIVFFLNGITRLMLKSTVRLRD
jgi:phosphate transport system permease protein